MNACIHVCLSAQLIFHTDSSAGCIPNHKHTGLKSRSGELLNFTCTIIPTYISAYLMFDSGSSADGILCPHTDWSIQVQVRNWIGQLLHVISEHFTRLTPMPGSNWTTPAFSDTYTNTHTHTYIYMYMLNTLYKNTYTHIYAYNIRPLFIWMQNGHSANIRLISSITC